MKYNPTFGRDLDHAVVILISDEKVTVRKQLDAIGIVEQVAREAAIGENDLLGVLVYFDHAFVRLIDDQDVVVG